MRQSKLLMSTLREVPAEAEARSHQWMLRGGYIRQAASGIYSFLPLGYKVLRKIECIIREEMDAAGAQELHMPAMQPAELWKASGRYELYGPELMRMHDRHEREFALGPTHEEVVVSIARQEISSYRQLPVNVYQIQTKFRDERRPRFGLLRGREFLMKDAYSFDRDWEGLDVVYRQMFAAYERIFQRMGLEFRAVEADSGAIGGQGETHEFMALAEIGEDTVVSCSACSYAANLERAGFRVKACASDAKADPEQHAEEAALEPEQVYTPGIKTITELADFLVVPPVKIIKTLIYEADGQLVAVLVRGDREVNEVKVKNDLQAEHVALASPETVLAVTGAEMGFAGPAGLVLPILADKEVAEMTAAVAGANLLDTHVRGIVPGIHFSLEQTGDFRNAEPGDKCLLCGSELEFHRGIELGHVFKLGTKYSAALDATFVDQDGQQKPFVMGCYGIGVSRVMAAVAEQSITEERLIWPLSIAPFHVHIIPISMKDDAQRELSEQLYVQMTQAGIDVLLDDREERAGVKFKDADLAGAPMVIIVGRGAGDQEVEWLGREGVKESITSIEALERAVLAVKGLAAMAPERK
ncbi:prolyl-tRNA synthetase [Paenibacillus algicola]|uniref:Proline--tRNA ligase n=1 Tax=Paenibacillus algicola TaxID=2565926 RepID=A0A4P8XHD5_9BACL|nr:proline--tRNA ligase [Paenibacillus algicola]QCT01932.1 prolyl-tRNA synthetase [Paenibacillus algicola]